MTIASDNAHRFATTQEAAARACSNAGRREAIAHLVDHSDREAAYARLVASVEQQARILGVGRITIPAEVAA